MSTATAIDPPAAPTFDEALLLGVLIGEGHFGGDQRQAHVNVKMHVRHEPLLRYLHERWPGSRLYGPYLHDGRNYYQLMFRGAVLRYRLIPTLARLPWQAIDPHSYGRFLTMLEHYNLATGPAATATASVGA